MARRRAPVTEVAEIERRDHRWVIVDLVGRGQRVRTVPVPLLIGHLDGDLVDRARLFCHAPSVTYATAARIDIADRDDDGLPE